MRDSLYSQASPYLYPFVLEYSIIAVATMAMMYQTVTIKVTQDILDSVRKMLTGSNNKHKEDNGDGFSFTKSHTGKSLIISNLI